MAQFRTILTSWSQSNDLQLPMLFIALTAVFVR